MNKIRVFIADDHTVLRAGLKSLLNSEMDIQVVGEASDGGEAVLKVMETKPDVVLLDLNMPICGGIECAEILRREAPNVRILVLTMHDDEQYMREVLRAGVSGYLLKSAADTDLLSAIRKVYNGENYLDPCMTSFLLKQVAGEKQGCHEKDRSQKKLSERETEVLRLIALGHTNQEVADILVVSVKTVETYKARLMDKLELRRRAELVRYAKEHNYV